MKKYIKKFDYLCKASASVALRWIKGFLTFLKNQKNTIQSITASSIQLVPLVLKKPSVLWRWLFVSHWFYVSIILLIVFLNTVVYAAIDKTLLKLYPPVKTEKFLGLLVQKHDDPRVELRRKLLRGGAWTGVIGLNAYVLLLCLPSVVRRATRRACDKEDLADQLITDKPSESIILYNKALRLAVDQSQESILKSKIETLNDGFKSGRIERPASTTETTPELKGTGTILLDKSEISSASDQGDAIGQDGRYRIEGRLGQGAMGIVLHGKDQLLFRDVALKKLTAGPTYDQNLMTRFQQEARALARLSHPNIVQIYDFIQEDNHSWIAMEYVEGTDLESHIYDKDRVGVIETVKLCALISDAMNYAHCRGVVHRDFKPSNVLVTVDGEPKVMDFGLAKLAHSSIVTMEGSLIGSPAFMSPEQAMGKTVDERSDIYALGVTLYQMLTGTLPFEGDLKSVITQKISGKQLSFVSMEKHVPGELVKLVRDMTANDPDERTTTMNEVGQAFRNILKAVS